MPINVRDRVMLWGRASARCSLPECRAQLLEEGVGIGPTLIGECCHIVGESEKGPRGGSTLKSEERNNYSNLILLCRNHHKVIDENIATYTITELHRIKSEHEAWVAQSLNVDNPKLRDEIAYAEIVDEWGKAFDLADWEDWVPHLGHFNEISRERFERLEASTIWLAKRVWPGRYRQLDASFNVFLIVIKDLISTFEIHAVADRSETKLITERFYKKEWYAPPVYEKLIVQYLTHTELLKILTREMTKACNFVCDMVRATIDHSYRRTEGVLLHHYGAEFGDSLLRFEYDHKNINSEKLYLGLEHWREQALKKAKLERKG